MSQPLEVLARVEEEISALLVAGLARQRGGRDQMDELAGRLAELKLERLAAELRALSQGGDPRVLAGNALTALAMVRKVQERISPWPEVHAGQELALAANPAVRIGLPGQALERPDAATLADWMESGNGLLRAHAATLLVERDESLPELTRLARKGTVTVRREAIAVIGRLRGEAALQALIDSLGDIHCWRALIMSILPHARDASLLLAGALPVKDPKKRGESKRLMSAGLLYRLGDSEPLRSLLTEQNEDPVVRGLAVAAVARSGGGWALPPALRDSDGGDAPFLARGIVAVARAEATGDLDRLIEVLDGGAINEVRTVVRWAGCATRVEDPLAAHYLAQLTAGRAKDRDRAASVLRGLAAPGFLPRLATLVGIEAGVASEVAEIAAETGGSQATGLLLDLVEERTGSASAFRALTHLGDPATAPALLNMLWTSPDAEAAEQALIALGDSAVGFLAREMHAREGTPAARRIQQILLQMKGARARKALQGTDPDSVESLLGRLGHSRLGEQAAKGLSRHGTKVLDRLQQVLEKGSLTARLNALGAIAAIKNERSEEIIRVTVDRSLRNSGNNTESLVCVRGLEILARRDPAGAAPLLVRGLASGAYQVQQVSARALLKIGSKAVPLLMPLLDSSNPSVRAVAVETIGKLQAVEAEEKVIELLSDRAQHVGYAAAVALGSIGSVTRSERAADALGAALLRDVAGWPAPIIEALARTGNHAAVPYLRRYCELDRRDPATVRYLHDRALAAIKRIEATAGPSQREGIVKRIRGLIRGK